MSFSGTLGLAACTCLMQSCSRVCLSVSFMRGLASGGGAASTCGAVLVGASGGGLVCCAIARVAAASVPSANTARFTVHLLRCTKQPRHALRAALSERAYSFSSQSRMGLHVRTRQHVVARQRHALANDVPPHWSSRAVQRRWCIPMSGDTRGDAMR